MYKGEDEWDREELSELKNAVQEVPSSIEKQERWRRIADIVGTRSKHECYEKYKKLKEEKLARKQSPDAEASEAKPTREPSRLNEPPVKPDSSRLAALSAKPRSSDDSDDDLNDLLGAVGLPGGAATAEAKDSNGETAQAKGDVAKQSAGPATSLAPGQGVRLGRGVLRGTEESKPSDRAPAPALSSLAGGGAAREGREAARPAGKEAASCARAARGASKAARVVQREPIRVEEANEIKALLFNDPRKAFPDAWKKQGLYFTGKRRLGYGLVQRAGGPCGVVAALNAYALAELLYSDTTPRALDGDESWQQPSPEAQQRSLLVALSSVLFAASGGSGKCVVCLPTAQHLYRTSVYTPDGITERVTLVSLEGVESPRGLEAFFREHLAAFADPTGHGCVLVLLSSMLSRGLERVRGDMDEGFAGEVRTLLDRHHYMSQEGVNLLLCGRAASNVFNGERVLNDAVQGSEDVVRLRGVPARGPVGFLSLLEAYNYIEVGDHYKVPRVPVWVVFSESHYSVLFGARPELVQPLGGSPSPFDVYYWDPLAGQAEVIRLTVQPAPAEALPDPCDARALIPPLDLALRTKWTGCSIDWNDTEPIL